MAALYGAPACSTRESLFQHSVTLQGGQQTKVSKWLSDMPDVTQLEVAGQQRLVSVFVLPHHSQSTAIIFKPPKAVANLPKDKITMI